MDFFRTLDKLASNRRSPDNVLKLFDMHLLDSVEPRLIVAYNLSLDPEFIARLFCPSVPFILLDDGAATLTNLFWNDSIPMKFLFDLLLACEPAFLGPP